MFYESIFIGATRLESSSEQCIKHSGCVTLALYSAILLYSVIYIALKITEIPVYQEQGTFKYEVLKISSGLAVSNDAMC